MPNLLQATDALYRVIDPDHYEGNTLHAAAFEDAYDDLSFYVDGYARPEDALWACSKRKRAKDLCGTGKNRPSPRQMYNVGYRVARLPAGPVLDCPLATKRQGEDGSNISGSGHFELTGGQQLADTWARLSRLLSETEIFPP